MKVIYKGGKNCYWKSSVRSRKFLLGEMFLSIILSEFWTQITKNIAKITFIVHGTSSSMTKLKQWWRACRVFAYHQHDEQKFSTRGFWKFYYSGAPRIWQKGGSHSGVWGWNPQPPKARGVWGLGPQPPTDFYGSLIKNTHFSTFFIKKWHAVSAITIDNAKIFSQLMSKSIEAWLK